MPRTETTPLARYRQLVQVLASLARSSHEVEAVVRAVHQQAGTLFPAQITLLALRQPGGDWLWELYEARRRYTHAMPFYPDGLIEGVLRGQALSIPDLAAYLRDHPVRARQLAGNDRVVLDIGRDDRLPEQRAQSMLYVPLEV